MLMGVYFLALLQPRHVKAFLSHAKSGVSMLAPELLKRYIQEGKLTPEGPNRILLPSSPDLEIPSPHALITASTSTYAHYLFSENEPVSPLTLKERCFWGVGVCGGRRGGSNWLFFFYM